MSKQYCLEKLRNYNKSTKSETWIPTERYSDSLEALSCFLADGYRIVDTHSNNREVRRNFDSENW
ncbi:hypothetical protein BC351_00695 [Paenibacillus ferrarius]|uniref:Uncharacterized protein n=1 Tax=Paenibacillus ferrarius TaxID=1469647 RepID=A0A1V4HS87_9BACL|nr:hypothetical protein [Paenibacillus ferrarius]OPH61791.1 hypothetical protein BC351_00695 [Paenibacillus ferrarius]